MNLNRIIFIATIQYGMCGEPANPPNGEYVCLYEHEYGYSKRTRRDAEPDYDYERGLGMSLIKYIDLND